MAAISTTNNSDAYQRLIDSSRSGAASGTGSAGRNSTTKVESAQQLNDRFLTLLIAQMNSQDPLNPLDNAQVTSQMAQINTVTGINGLNDTVGRLLEQFARLEAISAAQLTGRNVLVEGSQLALPAQGDATGGYSLPTAADAVTVQVRDANGLLVRELSLGAQKEGIGRFAWDGRTDSGGYAPAGNYTFAVTATAGGKEIGATALAARRVEAVMSSDGSTQLVLAGGGQVAYSDIKQIL